MLLWHGPLAMTPSWMPAAVLGQTSARRNLESGDVPVSGDRAGPGAILTGSVGTQERFKFLLASDYCSHHDTARVSAQVQSAITNSMPGWHVSLAVVYGAFEDDSGLNAHLDGATARLKGERLVKRMRVDLLTSCAKVLRSIGAHLPDFLIGFGQGGLIAGMLRFPLVVECTLQARNLQRSGVWKVVTGWAQVKGIWACRAIGSGRPIPAQSWFWLLAWRLEGASHRTSEGLWDRGSWLEGSRTSGGPAAWKGQEFG